MRIWDDLIASRRALFGFVVVGFGWAAFSAQVPVIKGATGLGDAAWGTLVLIAAVGAIMAMWLAPLAHGLLGRWSMIFGFVVMVVGFCVTGAAWDPVLVGLGLFAAAAGSGIADVFANAEVSEAEADTGRSLMNLNHGLFSVAYAVAAGCVAVAREAGLGPLMVFIGLAAVVGVLTPFLILPQRVDTEAEQEARGLPRALVLVGGLVVLAAFLGEAASEGWSALHVERTLGGGPGEGALGPALLAAGMAVGRLGGHLFGAGWPPVRVMILASCLAGVGLITAGFAPSVPVAYVGFVLGGLGVSVVGPLALGLVGQAVPRRLRLAAIAQAAGLGYAAFFLGPVLMGLVAEGFGLRVSFYVIGAIMFAVAALLIPAWSRMLRG
ncbi:MAG: MFS transporter [Pseudomonadota bacterium]